MDRSGTCWPLYVPFIAPVFPPVLDIKLNACFGVGSGVWQDHFLIGWVHHSCPDPALLSYRSKSRRFISLVDELYRYKVKLVCTAAHQPDKLFAYDELTKVCRFL